MQFKNALNPILLNCRCFSENWIPFRNLRRAGKLQFFVSAQQFVLTTSNQTFFAFVKQQNACPIFIATGQYRRETFMAAVQHL
jgi:hypothetical protein